MKKYNCVKTEVKLYESWVHPYEKDDTLKRSVPIDKKNELNKEVHTSIKK